MERNVAEVMTSSPSTVETSTPVAEAARLMRSEDVGSLPIVEDDRLVGMLTDRDVVLRVVAAGADPELTTAGQIASRDLVTIDAEESVADAGRLMATHRLRRLPVVDDDGRLVGIVAQADVAQLGDDALTGEIVERISG